VSPISRTTPARLTAPATVALPRLGLYGLVIAYIVAGLFMRDPWKTDDVVGLATMLTAVREGVHAWLLPQVGHLAHAEDGPLITWVGALSVQAFGHWIGDIPAGRLPNLLWFGMMSMSVWYGTYLLGRRPEAQPLALPFGGEPTVRDYGRMLADAALLLLLATVGILQRVHETSEIPAVMAAQALALYALARMLDRPVSGALTLGVAFGTSFLARGWVGLAPPLLATALICLAPGAFRERRRWLLLAVAVGAALILAWLVPATHASEYWIRNWRAWNIANYDWPDADLWRTLRDLPWYLWPTWPLALLAIWRWRNWVFSPHVWVPLSFIVCALVLLVFTDDPGEADFATLAVPCAALAAFSLPTLRRGVVNTLDWFAVMCFSLTLATVWLGWVALNFGFPPRIAHNIQRVTPGYMPEISWVAVALGLTVTVGWIALLLWRFRQHPTALWRGTVLSASGLAATWVLLVLLWQAPVDYARTYRPVSAELADVIQRVRRPGECVRSLGLGSGQRASFLVFDNLNFPYDQNCTLVLQQTTRNSLRDGTEAYSEGVDVLWQGGRVSDRNEVFRLLRVPAAARP
jgi:4-amino-4-deoxy-L-arabinose transferase-like glycosyltransferase